MIRAVSKSVTFARSDDFLLPRVRPMKEVAHSPPAFQFEAVVARGSRRDVSLLRDVAHYQSCVATGAAH